MLIGGTMNKMYKINKKRHLEIRELLSSYNLGELSTAAKVIDTILEGLEDPAILSDYIHDNALSIERTNQRVTEVLSDYPDKYKCPVCGENVAISTVNSNKRNQVGGNLRSVSTCMDHRGCGWQEFSEEKARVLIARRGKAMQKAARKHGIEIQDMYITKIEMDRPLHEDRLS